MTTSTRYAKMSHIYKIWQRIVQICGGFFSFFVDFLQLHMLQAHRKPLQKTCKGRNALFLFTLSEFSVEPCRTESWHLQGHTPSSAVLWAQLINHTRNLPGTIAALGRFSSCTFAILQHLHLVLLCCRLCSGEQREFVSQGEKMYTVFSVRDWL